MMRSFFKSRWLIVLIMTCLFVIPASAQQVHIVKPSESLSMIAKYYGTTVEALAHANGIVNTNLIYAGQILTIPSNRAPLPSNQTYTVKYGDTLTSVAERYNVSVEAIVAINPITSGTWLYPGQVLAIPVTSPVVQPVPPIQPVPNYYYVQPGDTLYKIAARLGKNIYDIAEANGLLNLNRIYAGTWLRIP